MNQPKYATGQPVNLFDGVIAALSAEVNHAGVVIGFPSDTKVTVALFDARYCESDGRKEATAGGQMTRFFRADQGIVCLDTLGLTLDASKIQLAVPWGGTPIPDKRGVIETLDLAVCTPQPLSKSASSTGAPGGSVSAS